MDFFHGRPAHDFSSALGIANVHMKKELDDAMKHAAGKLAAVGLFEVQHRAGQPARADHAIGLLDAPHQFMKGVRRGCAVRIHVTYNVCSRRQLQSFD